MQRKNLPIHMKIVHFKERQHKCKICEYQATTKGHLSTHVKNVHQRSENIVCRECNKSIQKKNLTKHIKLFHSEKQTHYKCKICKFKTIHTDGVKKHVKNVHPKAS